MTSPQIPYSFAHERATIDQGIAARRQELRKITDEYRRQCHLLTTAVRELHEKRNELAPPIAPPARVAVPHLPRACRFLRRRPSSELAPHPGSLPTLAKRWNCHASALDAGAAYAQGLRQNRTAEVYGHASARTIGFRLHPLSQHVQTAAKRNTPDSRC